MNPEIKFLFVTCSILVFGQPLIITKTLIFTFKMNFPSVV